MPDIQYEKSKQWEPNNATGDNIKQVSARQSIFVYQGKTQGATRHMDPYRIIKLMLVSYRNTMKEPDISLNCH